MSSQNRFLLPHTSPTNAATSSRNQPADPLASQNDPDDEQENNQHSVDTDFDSYWEEEARNPHRNRIRIGRQYQATVPPILKAGEKDHRRLDDLETLSFCPKRSAKVSDAELEHYFTIAKSLNLFASLVETRSLLGRDVTIADLNHIRNKEGLSLASVIQPPVRQTQPAHASTSNPNPLLSPLAVSQQSANNQTNAAALVQNPQPQPSVQKSPPTANCDGPSSSSSLSSSKDPTSSNYTLNQPLMKALSHFISLHHPCHHDRECKKLLKDFPLEDDIEPTVSITAGNLRQGISCSSKDGKHVRSRSALKQAAITLKEEASEKDSDEHQAGRDSSANSPSFEDWTREEVELFSKAIEVCGKNFGSIKKEFLPSKSVRSIVEYYYIGSRDVSENKKKSSQAFESGDGCSSPEKAVNNHSHGGGSSGGGGGGSLSSIGKNTSNNTVSSLTNSTATSSSGTTASNQGASNSNKTITDSSEAQKRAADETSNIKTNQTLKHSKIEAPESNGLKNKAKNIDARMSVYNFDEEFKDESPVQFECSRPGAEVKPLKAKPIMPHTSLDSNAANSNVGSLKFFMDGQLVLKLNACQDQQEGIDKCHWVQSGDKVLNANRQKRYTKRLDKSADLNQNGSQSNSVVSSFQDDDSKIDDLSGDEDSKESLNSVTNLTQQKNSHGSPTPKRPKTKIELNMQQAQLPSPINYNRMAVNNRIKERSDNLNTSPVINQSMQPWLQASSFAVAAALLGGLPFPAASNLNDNTAQNSINSVSMASKPMDLSLEHSAPKSAPKSSSRSRSRPRNN